MPVLSQGTFTGNFINGWRLLNQVTSSTQLSSMGIMDWDHQKTILAGIKDLRAQVEQDLFTQQASMIDYAAELGLQGTEEEDAAAAKLQAIQRGRQDRQRVQQLRGRKIEEELGLTGSEEEQRRIAKMQAAQRGKADRKKVAEMKAAKAAEAGAAAPEEAASDAAEEGAAVPQEAAEATPEEAVEAVPEDAAEGANASTTTPAAYQAAHDFALGSKLVPSD